MFPALRNATIKYEPLMQLYRSDVQYKIRTLVTTADSVVRERYRKLVIRLCMIVTRR